MNFKFLFGSLIFGMSFRILIPLLPSLFKTKVIVDAIVIIIAITLAVMTAITFILKRRRV